MSTSTKQTSSKPGFLVAFKAHPESVGETYLGHMVFALRFSSKLLVASGAALVHAFIPALCETTASRHVRDLYEMCHHRGN